MFLKDLKKIKNRIDKNWKESILKILTNVKFFDREKRGKKKKKRRIE